MLNYCFLQRITFRPAPILSMLLLPMHSELMDINFHTHGTTQYLMTLCKEQCRK